MGLGLGLGFAGRGGDLAAPAGGTRPGQKDKREAILARIKRRKLDPAILRDKPTVDAVFGRWDLNGNGALSLAEIDKAVRRGAPSARLRRSSTVHRPP